MAPASWLVGASVGLTLLIFYCVTVQWLPALSWFVRGSADAQRIVQGDLWRTVTALTLHADAAHVLSNGIAVALFLGVVASLVGAGLAGALVLLAGAGGNLANAFLHGSSHVSVGASTAVFGAVGLLGSLAVKRRRRSSLSRWRDWLPPAAALALLGMLGLEAAIGEPSGRELATRLGCLACHSHQGQGGSRAPAWDGGGGRLK